MKPYKRPQQGAAAHVLVFSDQIETTVAGRATRLPGDPRPCPGHAVNYSVLRGGRPIWKHNWKYYLFILRCVKEGNFNRTSLRGRGARACRRTCNRPGLAAIALHAGVHFLRGGVAGRIGVHRLRLVAVHLRRPQRHLAPPALLKSDRSCTSNMDLLMLTGCCAPPLTAAAPAPRPPSTCSGKPKYIEKTPLCASVVSSKQHHERVGASAITP